MYLDHVNKVMIITDTHKYLLMANIDFMNFTVDWLCPCLCSGKQTISSTNIKVCSEAEQAADIMKNVYLLT